MNVSVFPRRRSVEMVLLFVAALALTLETAAPAVAQDRPPSEIDRTDTATSAPAQDSVLVSEPGFLTRAINFVDKEMTQRRGRMNDPFRRSTLSGGRTEVMPFVP